jgi:hypothetical protein
MLINCSMLPLLQVPVQDTEVGAVGVVVVVFTQ